MKLIDYLETLQIEYFEKIQSQFECMVRENMERDYKPNFENEGWFETLHHLTQNLPVNLDEQEEYLEKKALEYAQVFDEEFREFDEEEE